MTDLTKIMNKECILGTFPLEGEKKKKEEEKPSTDTNKYKKCRKSPPSMYFTTYTKEN